MSFVILDGNNCYDVERSYLLINYKFKVSPSANHKDSNTQNYHISMSDLADFAKFCHISGESPVKCQICNGDNVVMNIRVLICKKHLYDGFYQHQATLTFFFLHSNG